jgi:hypothetical protein
MLQAESGERGASPLLRALASEPQRLERGLRLLDSGFRLTPELVVDLWMQDSSARPVIVLGEGSDGEAALLGRALCVMAEVRRMRNLLERLFQQEGARFDQEPRMVLVATRFSDALLGARDRLATLAIELVEVHLATVEGEHRMVVVQAGGAARREALPAADFRPRPIATTVATAVAAPAAPAAAAATSNGNGLHAANGVAHDEKQASLIDELKRKVLRISDRIEEEVVGATTRFLLQEQLLATVTANGARLLAVVGEADEAPRTVADRAGLNSIVDEIVRRYFALTRHQRPAAKSEAPEAARS